MHVPENPIPQGATVVYGNSAQLIAFSADTVNWYEIDTAGAPVIGTGNYFTTPVLLDTTTYYTLSQTGSQEQDQLTTTWAAGNGSTGNMFDITAFTDITIDSFLVNAQGSGVMEVWYKPGTYVGFTSNQSAWTMAGSYNVFTTGSGYQASLPVGGISIPAGETYGIYVTHTTSSVSYTNGNGTNQVYQDANLMFEGGHGGSYFSLTFTPRVWNGTIFYTAGVPGCSSDTIPVTAIVTNIPTQDAGVVGLSSPVDGIELSQTETVTIDVYNYGLEPIWNIPVSFSVDGGPLTTEIIPDTIQPYATFTYTFTGTADLSAIMVHTIEACTSHPSDIYSFNDCMSFDVESQPLVYCTSSATSTGYEEIVNVEIDIWANYSGPAVGVMYSDFTNIPGPFLAAGATYPISITTDYAPGYTTQYNCWVKVFIDWNHDAVYDPATETVFSSATTSSNTVSGTFMVPFTAVPAVSGMRVVFVEGGSSTSVVPCGTYTWGETEDYNVMVAPQIPNDGGVTEIITPGALEVENLPVPVVVEVRNFGTDTLTAFDIGVEFNGGAAVVTPWTGSIAPTMTEVITLPMVSPIGATNNICAYTIVPNDSNTFNDGVCKSFWATPQFEAGVTQIVHPASSDCGLGMEHITIRIMNYGDTISGALLASYILDGGTPVTEIVTTQILPGDSLDYAFTATEDFTVTTQNDTFDIVAYINLMGDPIPSNDTVAGTVISLYTPAPPLAFNDTVPYGSVATLTAQANAALYWYDDPAGGASGAPYLVANDTFITPILYDTMTVYVEASGAVYNNLQVGTDNLVTSGTQYPSPYCTYWWGNRNQFMIRASELYALGYVGGEINSVSWNTITPAPMSMTNFTIYIGHTNSTALSGWESGLTQVYFNPSFSDVAGWNEHVFTTPFAWDGVSNIVIETCFNNSSYQSGSQVEYSIASFNASYNYHADMAGVCSSTSSSSITQTQRPNMILNVLQLGCPSATIAVDAVVTGVPAYDASVSEVLSPISGIELTVEPVTAVIHNYGLNPIANFPVYYSINGGTPVQEFVMQILQSGDVIQYTFNAQADLTTFGTYDICVWTGLLNDGWPANDTICKTVVNDPLIYCTSTATSTGYEDIIDVGIGLWNNYSGPAVGSMYSDFSNIPGPFLAVGNTFDIYVTTDFPPNYSYQYNTFIEVYIDYNHDGVYTEPDEIAFSSASTSSNTVTGTFMVPFTAVPSFTGMRVVMVESGSASSVQPCGTYTWGETEDYLVLIAPQIPNDAGVTEILQPVNNMIENFVSPVEVTVQNYGTDTIWAMDVLYEVDGGTPVSYAYTGPLAPATSATITLPDLVIPGGYYDLCAYTVLAGDSNTFNDQSCVNLFAIPQFEAGILSIDAPESGCDLGLQDVTVTVANYGDTILPDSLLFYYNHVGMTMPVEEANTDTVFPFDTITYTFNTQIDLGVTASTTFDLFAWIDLVGDPILSNDTTNTSVWSGVTPDDPIVNNVTIWSGEIANLTANNLDSTLIYNWYDVDTNSLYTGYTYTSPMLFDTTQLYVEALTGGGGSAIAITEINLGGNDYIEITNLSSSDFDATGYTVAVSDNYTNINSVNANYWNLGLFTAEEVQFKTDATGPNYWGSNLFWNPGAPPSFTGWAIIIDDQGEIVDMVIWGWDAAQIAGANIVINGFNVDLTTGWVGDGIMNYPSDFLNRIVYDTDTNTDWENTTNDDIGSFNPALVGTQAGGGCASNLVPVTIFIEYADYDAAVWAVTEPVTGAYLSLVDVTAHVYNNGLLAISNIPISYSWNGVYQDIDTIPGPLLPGDDILWTFNQQLNIDTLWGQHTVCAYTSLPNDGYTLNDESCTTFTNMDGDGETCASAFQYGWVNDPPVTGETTQAGDEEWWSVEAPGDVSNAYFSLCGTTWDTKLEVYGNCTGFYLWYNDDNFTACSSSASHIDVPLLSAGTYYVKVFGYSTYFGVYNLEIGGDMPCIQLDGVVTDVDCNGQANGSIDLTVTNVLGTLPFSYSWSTGDISEDLFGLAAGTYCVTVSDASNCVETACFTITEPTAINLSTTGTFVSVFGGQDGAIDLTVTGGNAPYSYLWSNGATTEDLTNIYAGAYTVTVTDANGCMTMTTQLIHSPYPPGLPPVPTTITHEIDIPSNATVTLDGSPVAYGSLLIVYYDSAGTMVPGGYAYWSGMASTLIAYGADGTNPGFAAGEYFTWKLLDAATYDYYTGTVTYNTQYNDLDQFVANGSSGIWGAEFLSIFTQNVPLPLGWSIFSTYIDPLASDIEDILAPVVNNIIIVKSGTGLVYWPIYGLDAINNIIIGQGYQVKTSAATSADFVGYPVEPQLTPLDLPNGWSILGYLRQTPMAIVPIFSNQGMVNAPFSPPGILIIVKDDEGSIYWPQYGLDNINNMIPGEGYQIKLAVPAPQTYFTFVYPSNSPNSSQSTKADMPEPVKYNHKVNTGNNMTIGIPEGAWNLTPQEGDEIGVFNTEDKLVGSAVYTEGHTAVTVWGDDALTEKIDGAVENTALTLRYFDAATSSEQVIEVQKWESGNGMYAENEIAVIGKLAISKTNDYALYQNRPNPFKATTEIRFSLPEDAVVNIKVYNVIGEQVAELVSAAYKAGEHTVQFDSSDLPSGNYYYKMNANDFVATKPMHIIK
jgi:hypothetical protein